jgi:hypothetical protein
VLLLAQPLPGHRLGQFLIKPGYRHRGSEHEILRFDSCQTVNTILPM